MPPGMRGRKGIQLSQGQWHLAALQQLAIRVAGVVMIQLCATALTFNFDLVVNPGNRKWESSSMCEERVCHREVDWKV